MKKFGAKCTLVGKNFELQKFQNKNKKFALLNLFKIKEKKNVCQCLIALKAVTLGSLLIITTFHGSWFEVCIK